MLDIIMTTTIGLNAAIMTIVPGAATVETMTGAIVEIMVKKDMTGAAGRIDGLFPAVSSLNYSAAFRFLSMNAPNDFIQAGCIKMKPVL